MERSVSDEFLASSQSKTVYDFLTQYHPGKDAFEEKPVMCTVLGELQKNEITSERHSHN